jgi:hypothetical protein
MYGESNPAELIESTLCLVDRLNPTLRLAETVLQSIFEWRKPGI